MGHTARVVVLQPGTTHLEIQTLALPALRPHDVLVEISATGVCHSQLHQIHGARTAPILLGHEATGIVTEVGEAVTGLAGGDRVFVTFVPSPSAGSTRPAERSSVTLADGSVAYSNNVHTWATATVIDEQYVVPAPADTPMDLAAPVGCAVMTGAGAVTHAAGVRPGQSVAVWGVGGVGMTAVAAARIAGATTVIAVDLSDDKLTLARTFGATHTVNGRAEDAVEAIRRISPGSPGELAAGADWVIDCIGQQATITQALAAARGREVAGTPGGGVVVVGLPGAPIEVDVLSMLTGEKRLVGSLGGSLRPAEELARFVQWHRDGRLVLDALVTARYTLDELDQACADLEGGRILGRAIVDLTR